MTTAQVVPHGPAARRGCRAGAQTAWWILLATGGGIRPVAGSAVDGVVVRCGRSSGRGRARRRAGTPPSRPTIAPEVTGTSALAWSGARAGSGGPQHLGGLLAGLLELVEAGAELEDLGEQLVVRRDRPARLLCSRASSSSCPVTQQPQLAQLVARERAERVTADVDERGRPRRRRHRRPRVAEAPDTVTCSTWLLGEAVTDEVLDGLRPASVPSTSATAARTRGLLEQLCVGVDADLGRHAARRSRG